MAATYNTIINNHLEKRIIQWTSSAVRKIGRNKQKFSKTISQKTKKTKTKTISVTLSLVYSLLTATVYITASAL